MSTNLPLIAPIQKLLSSRKFVLVLGYIIAQFLVRAVPSFLPYVYDLTLIITFALGALFLHLSIEDIIKLFKDDTPTSLADAEQIAIDTGAGILLTTQSDGTSQQPLITTP